MKVVLVDRNSKSEVEANIVLPIVFVNEVLDLEIKIDKVEAKNAGIAAVLSRLFNEEIGDFYKVICLN